MLKRKYLAAACAAVLGVTMIGMTGCGDTEGKSGNDEKTKTKTSAKDKDENKALTVDDAAKKLETHLDKAQQLANGDVEKGFSGEIGIGFADEQKEELGFSEMSVKIDARSKAKKTGVDYAAAIDGKDFLTAQLVYDNDSETAYITVPELSDAYLKGTVDDIQKMTADTVNSMTTVSGDEDDDSSFSKEVANAKADAFKDLDFEAIGDDLVTYGDTIKDNMPEFKKGDDYTVEDSGVKIKLSTKVCDIKASDVKKVLTAVGDKAKKDDVLKKAYDLAESERSYEELVDEFVKSFDDVSDDAKGTVTLYYQGEELQGWAVKNSDKQEVHAIVASNGKDAVIDVDTSVPDNNGEGSPEGEQFKMNGALKLDGDTFSGSVNAVSNDENVTVDFKNMTVTEDTVAGTMTITTTGDENSEIDITLNNTASKFDVKMTVKSEGKEQGTITIKGEETDASDVKIPTGKGYNFTNEEELTAYMEGIDQEAFMKKMQDSLGEDTFNKLFGGAATLGGDDGDVPQIDDSLTDEELDALLEKYADSAAS